MALCREEIIRRRRSNQRRRLILEANVATPTVVAFSGNDVAIYPIDDFPNSSPTGDIDLPANPFEPGDGILVIATTDITGVSPFSAIQDDIDGTTGWVEHCRLGNTVTDSNLVIWTKTATGGESSITLSHLGQVSMDCVFTCTRIPASGWDPDGIVVGAGYTGTTATLTDTIPGLTPAAADAAVIAVICKDTSNCSPFTAPSGWTTVVDEIPPNMVSGSYGCSTAIYQKDEVTVDPTGDCISTANAFDIGVGIMMSFSNTNL